MARRRRCTKWTTIPLQPQRDEARGGGGATKCHKLTQLCFYTVCLSAFSSDDGRCNFFIADYSYYHSQSHTRTYSRLFRSIKSAEKRLTYHNPIQGHDVDVCSTDLTEPPPPPPPPGTYVLGHLLYMTM